MIFTACAICNRSFTRDSPRWCCAVCDTRICSACDLAGRDHKCAKIKRIGAEQYHADRGYALAVKKAVKECAEDTEGQFCYIC